MEKQHDEQFCRPVYLEDMRALVSIYRSGNKTNIRDKHSVSVAANTVQADFGIPLAILQEDQQIIGFARAVCVEGRSIEIHTCFDKKSVDNVSKRKLVLFSEEIFKQSFGDLCEAEILATDITILVRWINQWN